MKYVLTACLNKYPVFSKKIFFSILALLLVNAELKAQNELDVIRDWIHFSDASNSLYHHLASRAYDFLDKRSDKIAGFRDLSDWQQRQNWVSKTLMELVGPFPEKTPLNARVTAINKKDGYRVENIVYESQPGFYVTSAMYIPDRKKSSSLPAIIYCSGHSDSAYRSSGYQHVILNLVKKGFIVFAFDPVGQGERSEYSDPKTGKSVGLTTQHSYSGAQLFITGGSLARYMIFDGIRAVDYLLTRKEVDPDRIGITGRSGGGTQSAYIAAFDERIKAVAPENYITNFTRLFQAIGPQDAEQNFFNTIERGIDMADLLLVRAPRPALMITTTQDFFPIQGARETAQELSRLYNAYNAADKFNMVTDDAAHASTKKNREAMYTFFQKYLDNPGDSSDVEVKLLHGKELQVIKTGQVSSLKGESIFSLNYKEAERKKNKLQLSRKNNPEYFSEILQAARKLSGYQEPKPQEPVFTGRIQKEGYVIEKYFVKGDGDYVIPYLVMKPERPGNKALIYLDPAGKSSGAAEGGEMEWFVKNGFTVLAPDLIGTGEMGPGVFKGDSYISVNSYNLWFASMLIGRSIVGIRAGDVVKLTRMLKKNYGMPEVYGLAKKEMAPVLLHAASFDNDISRVALIEPYTSYQSIVMNRIYNPAFIQNAVPGSLGVYDLPDLAASLAPRKLMMAGITDGTGNKINPESASEELSVIKGAYHNRNAEAQLQIISWKPNENLYDSYVRWINN